MSELPHTEANNGQGGGGAAGGIGERAHDEHPALSGRRGEDIDGWIADCRPAEFRPSKLSRSGAALFSSVMQLDLSAGCSKLPATTCMFALRVCISVSWCHPSDSARYTRLLLLHFRPQSFCLVWFSTTQTPRFRRRAVGARANA